MDLLPNLALGLEAVLSVEALLSCFAGVTLGMLVGVLPGIGPLATISMLLPITFHLAPANALIMLAGIYYGGQYGGSITAILLNLPGSASSSVICLDGYPMTRRGRAGVALFITTLASLVGSLIGVAVLVAFAAPLSALALEFRSAEYFSMMIFGLVAAAALAHGPVLGGLISVALGLLLGTVGSDLNTGTERFTFGISSLWDGVSLAAVAVGVFGVAEVIWNIVNPEMGKVLVQRVSWRNLIPTRTDLRLAAMPILRGSATGTAFGILPGTGATISSFVAYALEKRISRTPERFGDGAIEGIAAPEAANNATAQAAFIPTLTLGVPGDAVLALMLGAMIIHGVQPGPGLITEEPELFWSLVVSFLIGNLMLVVLNLPLIGLWVKALSVPYTYLYPTILVFTCIGVYSVSNNVFDVVVVLVFGLVGIGMRLLKLEPAPMLLGFILGPMIEENLRRSLILSEGSFSVFIERPISLGFLVLTVAFLAWSLLARRRAPAEPDLAGDPDVASR